jgi:hypothetical protein
MFRSRFCPRCELLEGRLLLTTYTVINTNNSGRGSLRQAMLDANADHGHDSIVFDIPGSGVQTIVPLSELPGIVSPLTIDGTTQPGYCGQPLIELYGSLAGNANGLRIEAGATIKGLDINSFSGDGVFANFIGQCDLIDNYIGTDPTGTIAMGNNTGVYIEYVDFISHNLISGNRGTGIVTSGSLCTVVNNLIGTDATGTVAIGNGSDGLVFGSASTISGNVISGNGGNGIMTYFHNSDTIQNNLVGTDITGTHPLGNRLAGMLLGITTTKDHGFTVSGNTFAANGGDGITFGGSTSVLQDNRIGVGVDGTPLGNGRHGISGTTVGSGSNNLFVRNVIAYNAGDGVGEGGSNNLFGGNVIAYNGADGISVGSGSNNVIGGPGAGNVIAYNAGDGVLVSGGHSYTIRYNAIFANEGLGIELTYNANHNQEAPVLDLALAHHHRTIISGTMTSTPDTTFTIDLFASSTPGPQGEDYLTSIDVTTDDNGFAAFRTKIYGSFSGQWITATATDSGGNTSEFSIPVEADAQWAFLGVCLDKRPRYVDSTKSD